MHTFPMTKAFMRESTFYKLPLKRPHRMSISFILEKSICLFAWNGISISEYVLTKKRLEKEDRRIRIHVRHAPGGVMYKTRRIKYFMQQWFRLWMIYTVWTKMDDRWTETLIHISKHQKTYYRSKSHITSSFLLMLNGKWIRIIMSWWTR